VIPIVSQIFLTDGDRRELPSALRAAVDSVRRAFPKCSYTLYDGTALRQFIAERYEDEVVATYDALRPYAYRADLGRYCLLHALGGWYIDVAVTMNASIQPDEAVELLAFRENLHHTRTCWGCVTAVLYARPGAPALRTAINLVVRNRRENFYGVTPLCPTGPTLLGEALAIHRADPRHLYGDYLDLTPLHPQKNRAFVLPDGTILAWGKRAEGGDLTALGVAGGNNSNALWKARQIYAPPG
jgi:mannosyltransferase OCH1-like enzyme